MLFIVNASIRKVSRGLYQDDEENFSVSHPVEADSADEAEEMLKTHYVSQSERMHPMVTPTTSTRSKLLGLSAKLRWLLMHKNAKSINFHNSGPAAGVFT